MERGNGNYKALRVLFIARELELWRIGRSWSYSVQLGLEEGFRANSLKYLTLTSSCLSRARDVCAGKSFDQVWIHILPESHFYDNNFVEWVSGLAPVRIGLLGESLQYSPEEIELIPWLGTLQKQFDRWNGCLTHIVACDERDVDSINARGIATAIWWPQAVPMRFICEEPLPPPKNLALFCGTPYGKRADWLEHPELQGLLSKQPSPEASTMYPFLFDSLQANIQRYLCRSWLPGAELAIDTYLRLLRLLRRRCFTLWMNSCKEGASVVNLPSYVKTYGGRVVEGMAAGRPVISWEIPDRPLNKALFEEGREILLYTNPDHLADQIRRVLSDPDFALRIIENARLKVKRFHTIEYRVQQILKRVIGGEEPVYY